MFLDHVYICTSDLDSWVSILSESVEINRPNNVMDDTISISRFINKQEMNQFKLLHCEFTCVCNNNHIFAVLGRNVTSKDFPCFCLIITLITRILDTLMLRFNMSLKMIHFCSLINTLITGKLEMFWLNVSLKIILCCSLMITKITWILDSFIVFLDMSLKISFL